jgi:hypothetical protein
MRASFATLAVLLALIHPAHASCSGRPGTPNHVTLAGGPPGALELKWHNTASEYVVWDVDVTKNNKPFPGLRRSSLKSIGNDIFLWQRRGLDYAAEYCFKVRARKITDDCVSDRWSETVCRHPTWPVFGPR